MLASTRLGVRAGSWLAARRFGPLCGFVSVVSLCAALLMHGAKFQRVSCLLAPGHTPGRRGRMSQWLPWAMWVTTTGRFTVSITLVVIATLKERRVVAISSVRRIRARILCMIRGFYGSFGLYVHRAGLYLAAALVRRAR